MGFLAALGALLRGRRFRQLVTVRVVGQLGDGVLQVALAAYVLFSPERQPNAAAIAGALAAVLLPFSFLGPFAGVLLDRWARRQVLVLGNLARVLPTLAVAWLIFSHASAHILFLDVVVVFSVNRFLLSGLSASLPHVVEDGELMLANAVTPTSGTLAFLSGLAGATVARALIPSQSRDIVLVMVAAGCFASAGLLALRMPRRLLGPDVDGDRPDVRAELSRVAFALRAGVLHLRSRPVAAQALAVIAAHRFFYGLSTVATILLYRNYLNDPHDTDAGLAGLSVAILVSGLGFFVAAIVTPLVTERIDPQAWIVILLGAACIAMAFPAGLYTDPGLLVAAFVLGVSAQGVKICVDTLVQTHVDDAFRGRVFSLYDVAFNLVFVAAAAFGAAVVPATGKSYAVLALISAGYAVTAAGYVWASHQESSSAFARSAPSGPSSIRRSRRN